MATYKQSAALRGIDRHKKHGAKGMKNFVKESPFLITSFLFHLIVLLLLAFITAQEPREALQRIQVNMQEMRTEEISIEPMVRETTLSTDAMAADGGETGFGVGVGEGVGDAAGRAGDVEAANPDITGATSAVTGGETGQFTRRTDDGFSIAGGGGEGMEGAVDQFAVSTMNLAAEGKTLIVMVIDRTRSVIYLNLPRLIARMDNYFDSLDQNLTTEMMNNAEWIVVGYGQDVTFHTKPSSDLEHIKSALESVEICPTGEQNLGAALNTVLDRYGDYGHRSMLINVMTDGYGSDLRDGSLLERTIKRLRDSRASLYVFGKEARFASRRKRESLTLDPDLLSAADRATIRGFEGQRVTGWMDAGPESPRRELWGGNQWWGWDDRHMPPSGFGMYAMNRMVLSTGGVYFLLEEESDYDDEKLYSQYAPDICSVHEYERRMEDQPLRSSLKRVWEEMPNLYANRRISFLRIREGSSSSSARLEDTIRSNLDRARNGRRYASDRIGRLRDLLEDPETRSMDNYARWRAHTQLTIAELMRMRFMLGQYAEVLSREWDRHENNYRYPNFIKILRDYNNRHGRDFQALSLKEKGRSDDQILRELEGYTYYIRIRDGKDPDDFVGPREAKEEYDMAMSYAERIKEEHSETPWAWLASRIQSNLRPLKGSIEERRPTTRPPHLAL